MQYCDLHHVYFDCLKAHHNAKDMVVTLCSRVFFSDQYQWSNMTECICIISFFRSNFGEKITGKLLDNFEGISSLI